MSGLCLELKTLDLRSGYHHIALDKDSIKKTAFISLFGKYVYLKVPFGLAQAHHIFKFDE